MLQGSCLVVCSVLCACRDAQCCFCIHITMRLMQIMSQRCVQPCMCLGSMPCSIFSSFTQHNMCAAPLVLLLPHAVQMMPF